MIVLKGYDWKISIYWEKDWVASLTDILYQKANKHETCINNKQLLHQYKLL